ncbi:TatD DNase family protein [Metamycoplasma cloacale]|uniref:TatD family deoxyribonuclease n=1 Tax=Metamycoplasma cloacale TaxID=92401 RepID=A0A2Z4LLN2_9BACT|nr:TatD family hydrolase [Metamycoplasma cloacale]AWX42615.1 TatD family deoxyribonuclease [Metamycoplasma cloacale]VEU79632.1 TatD DNase family protein [Metamycoplasma cloacale]
MKYIDIHTHPFTEYYANPLEVVDQWYNDNMEKLFVVGTSLKDSKEILELCSKRDFLYPIIGIHPTEVTGANDAVLLEEILTKDVIAIGEFGLDYHYNDSPSKEIQKASMLAQLDLCIKHNLVAMLHIRDALDDAFEIVTNPKYKDLKIVMHSYSGDAELVKKYLPYKNIYFSISGVVTFKNGKVTQEAVKVIPVERLFCETDTPYLAPTPMRGKPNISPYVEYTYKFIADLKQIPLEAFIKQIKDNVKKVFNV